MFLVVGCLVNREACSRDWKAGETLETLTESLRPVDDYPEAPPPRAAPPRAVPLSLWLLLLSICGDWSWMNEWRLNLKRQTPYWRPCDAIESSCKNNARARSLLTKILMKIKEIGLNKKVFMNSIYPQVPPSPSHHEMHDQYTDVVLTQLDL